MIYLFNTNIVPDESVVRTQKITEQQAKALLAISEPPTSAIGHQSTADAFSEILGITVPVNRINATPTGGDKAISLKLNGRLTEGKILTRTELEEIGYTLFLISFYDASEYGIAQKGFIESDISTAAL